MNRVLVAASQAEIESDPVRPLTRKQPRDSDGSRAEDASILLGRPEVEQFGFTFPTARGDRKIRYRSPSVRFRNGISGVSCDLGKKLGGFGFPRVHPEAGFPGHSDAQMCQILSQDVRAMPGLFMRLFMICFAVSRSPGMSLRDPLQMFSALVPTSRRWDRATRSAGPSPSGLT